MVRSYIFINFRALSHKRDILKQEALDGKKIMGKVDVDGAFEDNPFENYEKIKKDLSALSKEEQMDVVYRYAFVPHYCPILSNFIYLQSTHLFLLMF